MSIESTVLYRSSNGDRWSLMREPERDRRFVRHEANPSSGGRVSDIDIADFLSSDSHGPEHAALRRLLDSEQVTPEKRN
jgi:hypothetical protein